MPFSETCFNELAWAFFCETSNPRCAMQQPELAFIPIIMPSKREFSAQKVVLLQA